MSKDIFCSLCNRLVDKFPDHGNYYCTNITCPNSHTPVKVIDIAYKEHGVEKALSNLFNYPFVFQQVECTSMESFLRSLVEPDPKIQAEICKLQGINANAIKEALRDWRESQILYWDEREYLRVSPEYETLISSAFTQLYLQSDLFRTILKRTKDYILIHSIGGYNPRESLLTESEYIEQLLRLRDKTM